MKFSEKLQKLRKEKNYSQEQLADMLDVSRQSVSKWESGQTYPEMDKLISLCKIFGCTMDDLVNDEVNDETIKEKRVMKNSTWFDELLLFIQNVYELFSHSSFKTILKYIGEMVVVVMVECLIYLPYLLLTKQFTNLFSYIFQNNWTYYGIMSSFFNLIYLLLCMIVVIYIFDLHHFKKNITVEKVNKEIISDSKPNENSEEMIQEYKTAGAVVPHDRFNKLLHFLGKCFIFGIKLLTAGIAFFGMLFLIILMVVFVVDLYLLVKGVFLFGILLGTLALSVGLIVILIWIYTFILNKTADWKKLGIVFLSSLCCFGLGCGIGTLEFSSFNIHQTISPQVKLIKHETVLEYEEKMYVEYWNVTYEIDDSLKNIIIQVEESEDNSPLTPIVQNDHVVTFNWNREYSSNNQIKMKYFIEDLKSHNIYSYYDYEHYSKIIVRCSNETYKKLMDNEKASYDNQNMNEISDLTQQLKDLEVQYNTDIHELEVKNQKLQEQNDGLTSENEQLTEQIQEIQNKLESLNEILNSAN